MSSVQQKTCNECASCPSCGVKTNLEMKNKLLMLVPGVLLFALALIAKFPSGLTLLLFIGSYLLIGGTVILSAAKSIANGQVFNENFLMTIATIGAFAIQEYPEAVSVMLFYQIGELFQDAAVNHSKKAIRALLAIKPDYANLKEGNETRKVSPDLVEVGSIILVKPGERIPLDGKVIEGSSFVDTSPLTGESVPKNMGPGDEVLSGCVNGNGILWVEVTKNASQSTVSRILSLVEDASGKKAQIESFITRFAKYYTPAVVFAALALALLPPLVVPGASFSEWLHRGLVFLVVSCPCALVISIPLSFFGGIGGASKNGVLVKGGNFLEALNKVNTIVFDKTGTLTRGVFRVTEIVPQSGFSKEELLSYAASAEFYSEHPIARSVLQACDQRIQPERIGEYTEFPGKGVSAVYDGRHILAGSARWMDENGIRPEASGHSGVIVHVAVDKKYAGYLVVSDELKPDSHGAVHALRKLGISRLIMLTGDSHTAALQTASALGLDEFHADLLPHQKVEKLESLLSTQPPDQRLVFVGDGINDAPVLARADIGVAMGALGSDAAIEAADIVLMTDEPSRLADAIRISRKTGRIVWQNIALALTIKAIVLAMGAGGIATMWEAVFADVGVALLAVLNAMRAMTVKKDGK